jgi:hypothetical protein
LALCRQLLAGAGPGTGKCIAHVGNDDPVEDDEIQDFLNDFYRDPDPAIACRVLAVADEGNWLDDFPLLLYGFARAVDRYSSVRAAMEDLAARGGARAKAASRVLETARSISFLETLEMPEDPEPGWLDLQWVEYGITGDEAPVKRIISVLDWDDVARQRLQTWLHNAAGVDWNAQPYLGYLKLFSRILFPVDIETGAIDGPVDIDLLIAMQVRDGNLQFDELPFEFGDDVAIRAAMKSAAVWSLTMKAEEHPTVTRLCREAAEQTGGAARMLLAKANTKSGQQPS